MRIENPSRPCPTLMVNKLFEQQLLFKHSFYYVPSLRAKRYDQVQCAQNQFITMRDQSVFKRRQRIAIE